MSKIARRQFLTLLSAIPALSFLSSPASSTTHDDAEQLIIHHGWVLKRSDLKSS